VLKNLKNGCDQGGDIAAQHASLFGLGGLLLGASLLFRGLHLVTKNLRCPRRNGRTMFVRIDVKVVRVGNSRAVLIPMSIAKALGWEIGSTLSLEPADKGIRLLDNPKGKVR
jgi:hypothetical protein